MRKVVRRDALRALGAAAVAASGGMTLGQRIAGAAETRYPIEQGAQLNVLRWKRFVQGDEDLWIANSRKFTEHTGVPVQIESVNGEDIRPKGAMAASVGAGPDIIMGPSDMPRLYPDKCVDLTDVAGLSGTEVRRLVRRLSALLRARRPLDCTEHGLCIFLRRVPREHGESGRFQRHPARSGRLP